MIIECCIRNNAQADCDVNRHGDLIRIGSNHSPVELLFLPSDFARLCFLEVYGRSVADSRQRRERARWAPTLGTCRQLRDKRLAAAVQEGRLSREQVAGLLEGPTPVSIDQVAGLLEGPTASADEAKAAERLRALAAMLRKSMAEDAAERRARIDARKAAEDAEKARIAELIDQHQSGDEAA